MWRRLLLRMFKGQPPGHRLVPTDYAPAMRALYGKGAVPAACSHCRLVVPRLTTYPHHGRLRPSCRAWAVPCILQARLSRSDSVAAQGAAIPARAKVADFTAFDHAGALY